jgi:flagellar hook-length control protein FliK
VAGPGGVGQPITLTLSNLLSQGAGLRVGQTFQAVIQSNADQVWVNLGSVRVPLEAGATLQAGNTVLVEVLRGDSGLQLRVTQQPSAQPAGSPASNALLDSVAGALRALGLAGDAARAQALVPPQVTHLPHLVEQAVAFFAVRSALGTDLEVLTQALQSALQGHAVTGGRYEVMAGTLMRLAGGDVEGLTAALRDMVRGSRKSLEARLALVVGRGGDLAVALAEDFRAELIALRRDEAFAAYLRARGRWQPFERAADRIIDRLARGALQNLRALEHPYLFLEVPFPPGSGFQHGQIHFFGDGKGRSGRWDKKNATVALDLSTTRLGDLWITLRVHQGHCLCTIRATESETVKVLDGGAMELADALASAGYVGAQVKVQRWDGDRVEQAGLLLQPLAGVDVSA